MRSFAKMKPSRKFANLQYSLTIAEQIVNSATIFACMSSNEILGLIIRVNRLLADDSRKLSRKQSHKISSYGVGTLKVFLSHTRSYTRTGSNKRTLIIIWAA